MRNFLRRQDVGGAQWPFFDIFEQEKFRLNRITQSFFDKLNQNIRPSTSNFIVKIQNECIKSIKWRVFNFTTTTGRARTTCTFPHLQIFVKKILIIGQVDKSSSYCNILAVLNWRKVKMTTVQWWSEFWLLTFQSIFDTFEKFQKFPFSATKLPKIRLSLVFLDVFPLANLLSYPPTEWLSWTSQPKFFFVVQACHLPVIDGFDQRIFLSLCCPLL